MTLLLAQTSTSSEATQRSGHAEELRQLSIDTASSLPSEGALASPRVGTAPHNTDTNDAGRTSETAVALGQ